jgi:hypothetical protein
VGWEGIFGFFRAVDVDARRFIAACADALIGFEPEPEPDPELPRTDPAGPGDFAPFVGLSAAAGCGVPIGVRAACEGVVMHSYSFIRARVVVTTLAIR